MRLTRLVPLVAALLGTSLAAQEVDLPGEATLPVDSVSADTVVAVVNGTEITLGELIVARQRLGPQFAAMPADQLFNGLLQQAIEQQLLADTLEEQPARVDYALKNEARSLRAGEAVNAYLEGAVTEEAIDEAYAELTATMEPTQEWNASHILVETEEEAAEIREEILAGADFAEMAAARSIGPSGPNGGELGWFQPGMMVAPFEEAVAGLEVGEVSEPVETQFGWHIVKLNDARMAPVPSREELYQQLVGMVQEKAFYSRIDELTEAGKIETVETGAIDPMVLNDLNLLKP